MKIDESKVIRVPPIKRKEGGGGCMLLLLLLLLALLATSSCHPEPTYIDGKLYHLKQVCVHTHTESYLQMIPMGKMFIYVTQYHEVCDQYTTDTVLCTHK